MNSPHRFAVAPMLDRTDRHFRYFFRQISRGALLYTEMVVDRALIHGDPARLLAHDPAERPLVLQLASADPNTAAKAAKKALPYGFFELNLNVGCPSEKSQRAGFGAILMRDPDRVAAMARAIAEATGRMPSIKHRLGLDDDREEESLFGFVERLAEAGVTTFVVHARKALLSLDTRKNRAVPPLRHDLVHRLKAAFPELTIITNGGIQTTDEALTHLARLDGVMVGRAAWEDPFRFADVDERIFGLERRPTRAEVARRMAEYLQAELERGTPGSAVIRPLFNLYKGVPGARAWRRLLGGGPPTPETLLNALEAAEEAPSGKVGAWV